MHRRPAGARLVCVLRDAPAALGGPWRPAVLPPASGSRRSARWGPVAVDPRVHCPRGGTGRARGARVCRPWPRGARRPRELTCPVRRGGRPGLGPGSSFLIPSVQTASLVA